MLFSIIIPTFNRAKILTATIRTVLAQTFTDFELLIVDDGSIDNTRDAVEQIKDPRVRFYFKQNEERSIARNFGAEKATGHYLIFLDSDDRLLPDHLQKLHDFITSKKESPSFLVSSYNVVNGSGEVLTTFEREGVFNKNELVFGNSLCCSPVTINAELFRKFRFNTDPRLIVFEDWELWLRIISGTPLYCVPGASVTITNHNERSVITATPLQLTEKINFFSSHAVSNITLLKDHELRRRFLAGLFSYGALHIAMYKNGRKGAWKFLYNAMQNQPSLIFRRRFPAIIKHLLFR
jgi:glycosyltransferase involved in cell wall biosynthesis